MRGVEFLRTPEARFAGLPHFPFEPHYFEVGRDPGTDWYAPGLRMHYVDEGPREASPILMLHGEPSWSYLYRHMIRICVEEGGQRVVAPDLIGFGRSDKPCAQADHSYARHVEWVRRLVAHLDLRDITLVCQDWGSLIGLRVAAEMSDRFARVVVSNGFLPTGDRKPSTAFFAWQAASQRIPRLPVGRIVDLGSKRRLMPQERAAYDAPFPFEQYKAGPRVFPMLVPTSPGDPASSANRAAWEVLARWDKPFLLAFSDGDPITRGADRVLAKRIPGARGREHVTLRGGHFIQEDAPREFAEAALGLLN